jgi:hypothetical protein
MKIASLYVHYLKLLKHHARDADRLTHFLTYADNNAVGYFVKQVWLSDLLAVYNIFLLASCLHFLLTEKLLI